MVLKMYNALAAQLFKEKIAIRLWPAKDPFKYCPNGIYGKHPGQPVILVPRVRNGTWINPDATPAEISTFIGLAPDVESEMIYVAHEFGHHFSTFSDYEKVRQAFDDDSNSVSQNDWQRLYDEEVFAWDKAQEVLTGLQFDNWDLFNELKNTALQGYRKGYGL